jgi:hypothetical protein
MCDVGTGEVCSKGVVCPCDELERSAALLILCIYVAVSFWRSTQCVAVSRCAEAREKMRQR